MTLRVLAAGASTTVQDRGREGWRHLGVARGGALDPTQATLANRLVGNPADAAVLEIAMRGPTLGFDAPLRIALCGARIDAAFVAVDGTRHPVPCARPVALPAGTLALGTIRHGLRAWLAVGGGIDVPRVLGGRGTDLRGGFGGFEGRALQVGDRVPVGACAPPRVGVAPEAPRWWIALDPEPSDAMVVRYVPSSHALALPLSRGAWRVDPRSDRQGLRCAGTPLDNDPQNLLSAPVAPGTIQLPPDGRPIVLLADAQTVGGYPRLGHVVAADLHRLAQARAGDALRFEPVDIADAAMALQRRNAEVARLEWAIDLMSPETGIRCA